MAQIRMSVLFIKALARITAFFFFVFWVAFLKQSLNPFQVESINVKNRRQKSIIVTNRH